MAVGLIVSWALLVGLVIADRLDAAYYATPSRLGEIFAGALLACVASPRRLANRGPLGGRLAWLALLVLLVGMASAQATGRWDYAIWLPTTSVATVTMIGGSVHRLDVQPGARVAAPRLGLGRISYGVYVVHWPIFLLLTADRTGLDGVALDAARRWQPWCWPSPRSSWWSNRCCVGPELRVPPEPTGRRAASSWRGPAPSRAR